MKNKEAKAYILSSLLFASVILAAIVHGPRLLAYMSQKSGYHAASTEAGYMNVPVSIGRGALYVLIADTDERRHLGLSHREGLGDDQGMLFVFDAPGRHGIWMKDMKFPIDIIWLDNNLKVIHIEEHVSPATFPTAFGPESDASFVLETKAGFVKENEVFKGSELVIYR